MFAVGLTAGSREITHFEIEKPKISAPDEVLIRIVQAGLDGTDKAVVKEYRFDPPPGEDRIVIGHEAVGVVEEIGTGVKNFKVGDIVVPTVRRGCGMCPSCIHGASDTCSTGLFKERGLHKMHGFYTEYIVDTEEYLVKIPPELKNLAVLVEPISIAEKGIQLIRHIQGRLPWSCSHPTHKYIDEHWADCKKALVVGGGPLGIIFTMLLRLHGLVTYVAVNRDADDIRVEIVKSLNAVYFDSRDTSIEDIRANHGPFDVIIESSGASGYALDLISAMARNGIYIMTGIPGADRQVCLNGDLILRQMVRYNQILAGSVNSNRKHFELAVDDLYAVSDVYAVQMSKLLSQVFDLKDYKLAFGSKDNNSLKPIFKVSDF